MCSSLNGKLISFVNRERRKVVSRVTLDFCPVHEAAWSGEKDFAEPLIICQQKSSQVINLDTCVRHLRCSRFLWMRNIFCQSLWRFASLSANGTKDSSMFGGRNHIPLTQIILHSKNDSHVMWRSGRWDLMISLGYYCCLEPFWATRQILDSHKQVCPKLLLPFSPCTGQKAKGKHFAWGARRWLAVVLKWRGNDL